MLRKHVPQNFFANMTKGTPIEKCPDNDGHNVDTIDGIAMTVPVTLAAALKEPLHQIQKQAASCADVTRQSPPLQNYVGQYAELLCQVLGGKGLPEVLGNRVVQASASRPDPVVA